MTDLPLVKLIYEWKAEEALPDLPSIAEYAHAIGPRGYFVKHQLFMDTARKLDLVIHPWNVKNDFLEHADNAIDENLVYYNSKVDGIFTEFP